MNLSKSLYTRAIQCPKSLWLKKYKPEVLTPPDESAKAVFETGNVVGDLACELFAGGKEVPYSKNYDEMIATTQRLIDEGVEYIYEATFNYGGILVMVDVLHVKGCEVSLYEVKSSTGLKDIYLHDVSIQYYVLAHLGFCVKEAYVVHVNNSYLRGDELDLKELFCVVDVSEEVRALQHDIPSHLSEFKAYLDDKENEPDIEIGKHCKSPYECDAKEYCWKIQRNIPEYSVFNIFNLGSKKQIELYEQGIVDIKDVPEDFAMTPKQSSAVQNYKSGETHIHVKAIKEFCESLSYPLYHLDFETYQQAVPLFKGISPYQQIPFQYSLHVEHSDGVLEHYEFLADVGVDPRRALAEQLVKNIPLHVNTLAYNMSFEKGVIKRLAEQFEDLSEHLMHIHENMKDLMTPFQKKHFVTPSMQGSYSIKYVLPALVPEFEKAYKELEGIQNGSQAMRAFASLHVKSEQEQKEIRKQLLAYCELDTLAMVKILKKLKEV
ncbi:DUF2779 domain-containing protein [Sulfurospirillum arcachonense]|uniref:DUF2779 domain-containing protein n=1 Tax=Sulfurospirillum arcachonense TaxID=57666 RepID=UPI00046A72CC|nr:DUF2779 domain-containing protein [Sulfurospirillum arcachonense]